MTSAIGQIAGGIFGGSSAGNAAGAIQSADQQGIQALQNQYNTTSGNLTPAIQTGNANLPTYGSYYTTTQNVLGNAFNNAQTAANNVGTESMAQLEATPGYQFALQQGNNATKAAASALGLGNSGAVLKGISNYTNGLASQNYQNIYNQQLGQAQLQQGQYGLANQGQQTIFNQLGQPVNTGVSAAGTLGGIGQQTANQVAGAYNNIGQAQAGSNIAQGNAFGNIVGGVGNGLFGSAGLFPNAVKGAGSALAAALV